MLTTTLNAIRQHSPCKSSWEKLLKSLNKTQADDEPLSFEYILNTLNLDDALWCMRAAPKHDNYWRLYAVWCARQVQHLMTDPRSLKALDIAERHINGLATDEELREAAAYANSAYAAAGAAHAYAADAAAYVNSAYANSAYSAYSAYAAAYANSAYSAYAAAAGAATAAGAAYAAAMREKQKVEFLRVVRQSC